MKSLSVDASKPKPIPQPQPIPQPGSSPTGLKLFPDIPSKCRDIHSLTCSLGFKHEKIHSSFIRLGLRLHQGSVSGSLDSCLTLISALRDLVTDYRTPPDKVLNRDLYQRLNLHMDYVIQCHPVTVSMVNSVKKIQTDVTELSPELTEDESRNEIIRSIDRYIKEEISCALQAVTEFASARISDGDVILTFGHSTEIQHILYHAFVAGKEFSVIVVDSNPDYTGLKMVQFLTQLDRKSLDRKLFDRKSFDSKIQVSYIYINSIAHVINDVSKVLLGVDAIFANGYVMGRMGSSQVALIAKRHNVPVIVCCETFAFSDAVPTDAFVFNEAGQFYFCWWLCLKYRNVLMYQKCRKVLMYQK